MSIGNKYVLITFDHYSKWKSYVDLECPNTSSLTMAMNGWRSLMLYVKTMELFTNSLHLHGHSEMGGRVASIDYQMYGLTMLSSTHIQGWDTQLQRILFGYWCGVQASTRYSPYMVLIRCSLRLIVSNSLNGLCDVVNEQVGPKAMAGHILLKKQLVSWIHKSLLENVEQVQKKQGKVYAFRKGL